MAVQDPHNIYRNYNFRLKIDNIPGDISFAEVSGMNVSIEVLRHREGGDATVRKCPGQVDHGDITLKWGMTDSTELWKWLKETAAGKVKRSTGSITLLDPAGEKTQATWNLSAAWPSCWRGAHLDAMGQEIAIETLVLTHEGIERK